MRCYKKVKPLPIATQETHPMPGSSTLLSLTFQQPLDGGRAPRAHLEHQAAAERPPRRAQTVSTSRCAGKRIDSPLCRPN